MTSLLAPLFFSVVGSSAATDYVEKFEANVIEVNITERWVYRAGTVYGKPFRSDEFISDDNLTTEWGYLGDWPFYCINTQLAGQQTTQCF